VDGDCDDTDPCTDDTCPAGSCVFTSIAPRIESLEVFYAGKFSDEADPSRSFLANGSTATMANITNYAFGITGIRVFFDSLVTFATVPADAFSFEWTIPPAGTAFEPVVDVALNFTITAADVAGKTVVTIVINDDYVVTRWLKITVDATQVSTGGCDLDGELTGNPVSLPSGDGAVGGNAVFYVGNAPCDVDGDRRALNSDYLAIGGQIGPFPVPITDVFDVDKSGQVLNPDLIATGGFISPFQLPLISP
jgi:hypothetical protein